MAPVSYTHLDVYKRQVPDAIDVEKLNEELLGYLEMLRKYLYKEEG